MGDAFVQSSFALRAATKADLDAITSVVRDSFPDDPGCDYKFPRRREYADDFWKWTRREYEGYLDQPEKFAVLVVAASNGNGGGDGDDGGIGGHGVADKPIAVGVWDIAVETKPVGGGMHLSLFSAPGREV